MNFLAFKLKNGKTILRAFENRVFFSQRPNFWKAGFTLTELIVVTTIATIIMTAVVVQQSKWNEQLAINTQAYEVVLMIRQAQIYSLGVKEDKAGTSDDKFNLGYGVYISQTGAEKVVFFADRNKNGIYDNGEKIEEKTLTKGVELGDICANSCSGQKPKRVTIAFLRPNPKAKFYYQTANGSVFNAAESSPAIINLILGNSSAVIKVEANGQIYVQ